MFSVDVGEGRNEAPAKPVGRSVFGRSAGRHLRPDRARRDGVGGSWALRLVELRRW